MRANAFDVFVFSEGCHIIWSWDQPATKRQASFANGFLVDNDFTTQIILIMYIIYTYNFFGKRKRKKKKKKQRNRRFYLDFQPFCFFYVVFVSYIFFLEVFGQIRRTSQAVFGNSSFYFIFVFHIDTYFIPSKYRLL